MIYILAPFIGWLISGILKFCVNYIRFGSDAKNRIGNGGFPSTHTSIIMTTITYIGWIEGLNSPILGLGVSVLFIIIIDATGLRRAVGSHAAELNKLRTELRLREKMGHTKFEVLGGLVLGFIVGSVLFWLI
ncbi:MULTISPECIES: divergent PAP2 family protein [unclassified Paenibacillus]|uniref:divergent PAP2 family protein n=1 Tax=unclassified Paenibacillus TaxID=185978 RepID=UPI00362E75CE